MSSGSSGHTYTDANDVCRRAAWSNGEMRTSRCTPASAEQQAVGVLAGHGDGGALDAGVLARLESTTSRLKPRRSNHRRYMRSSISAQSCDSVPPAPG